MTFEVIRAGTDETVGRIRDPLTHRLQLGSAILASLKEASMQHSILMHEPIDHVGVAVVDLKAGDEAGAVTLEGGQMGSVTAVEDIPLGHKIAMRDIPAGDQVIKYGRPIGKATQAIARGAWVHTHNLKTLRWSR